MDLRSRSFVVATLAVLLVALTFGWIFRFQYVNDARVGVYRVNRWTGETVVLAGSRFIVMNPRYQCSSSSPEVIAQLREVRQFYRSNGYDDSASDGEIILEGLRALTGDTELDLVPYLSGQ